MMLDLKKLCYKYNVNVRGIIEVGAHRGQELQMYFSLCPERILLIEAIPSVAEFLKNSVKNYPQVKVVSCAISDCNGTAILHVTSNEQSSSLLPLKIHSKIYSHIVETSRIEVESKTLDSLLAELGDVSYNFLDIDVQGAELLVLRGAPKLLKHIDAINIEVNYAELYQGCVLEPVLSKFLKENGFEKKEETRPYHPTWGDAFYVRQV